MKVGILGAGQLAMMMAQAAKPLGIETLCLTSTDDVPAVGDSPLWLCADDDIARAEQFAQQVDVITYENENIATDFVEALNAITPVYPSIKALSVTQDRLFEKQLFTELEIPTPHYVAIDSEKDLARAVDETGLPAIVKTRRFGYDGKGQHCLKEKADIAKAWNNLQSESLILESFVPFEKEVSLLSVRSQSGETVFYPLVHNEHEAGILRVSQAPYEQADLQQQAETYAKRILNAFDYVGVLAIEFFVKDDHLIANEIAPRVHNSGHWTIEGANTSQFENHLRALCNLPLGNTSCKGFAAMINFISTLPDATDIQAIPGATFHDYHKSPRPNRKLGHVTLVSNDPKTLKKLRGQVSI